MSRVLVTGGLGFIGSNLVKELRKRGHDVQLCDLRHSEDSQSTRCDVSVFRQIERLMESSGFDYVYHAAAEYGRWNGEDYYENLWMVEVPHLWRHSFDYSVDCTSRCWTHGRTCCLGVHNL